MDLGKGVVQMTTDMIQVDMAQERTVFQIRCKHCICKEVCMLPM